MADPERTNDESRPLNGSSEHHPPTRGGFGEFSSVYRVRWALSHRNMRREWPADSESQLLAQRGAPSPDQDLVTSTTDGDAPNDRTHGALDPLESLQAQVGSRPGSDTTSAAWRAHEAVLDRLAANVRLGQSYGWTSCAIERVDGATHFSAWGVPPGDCERHPVPDWSTEA